jgi:selenocysteine-specific elongation factor
VVTGTTLAGRVKLGDEVQLLPAGKRARVRGLQVHGAAVTSAGAGRRVAINLQGLEKDDIARGDVLIEPDSLTPTTLFDAAVELLPGGWRPLRRGSEVLLHIGTMELGARVQPLDNEQAAAGTAALLQFTLEQQAAIAPGDRFILRSSTAELTIGGGQVLDAHPSKHRRQRLIAADKLSQLDPDEPAALLAHEIEKAPFGLSALQAQPRLNVSAAELATLVVAARGQGHPITEHTDGRQQILTLPANHERIVAAARTALAGHHAAHPLSRRGLDSRELLRMIDPKGAGLSSVVLRWCLEQAARTGALEQQDDAFALPGRTVELSERDKRAAELVLTRLNDSAQPDQPEEMTGLPLDKNRLKLLLEYLIESGQAVLAPGGVYFGAQVVERVREVLRATLEREGGITVGRFGDIAGSSRKYSIPLLQYFEQDGTLTRDGDVRRLK